MSLTTTLFQNLVIKKLQGLAYTNANAAGAQENPGSSAPIILSSKIWAQSIPESINKTNLSLVGTFIDSNNNSYKKYSVPNYSYIKYYENVTLTSSTLNTGIAYCPFNCQDGSNILINCIITLNISLNKADGSVILSNDTTYPWYIDSGTGYLTLIVSSDSDLSLKASFYRYEGVLGAGVTGITNVGGNIGIATANPTTALQVTGTTTSTTFNASSDYRLKSNIGPITRTVDSLKPIEYDFVCESHDMGFLAHEVQEYFPFLVNGEKDGENMQSINYNGFIALLVKEVQELKSTVKTLQNRIEILESK